jgi:pyruvate kinase
MREARELTGERRAKIICTLGPSTDDPATLAQLLASGMDAARLNLSYGEMAEHTRRIKQVRAAAVGRRPISIITDLPGRKVRLGKIAGGKLALVEHDTVRFVPDEGQVGDRNAVPVDRTLFHENMMSGDRILIGSGAVELVVTGVGEGDVSAEVVYGGTAREQAGVHAPGMPIRSGPITPHDLPYLKMAVEERVDYIGLSDISDGEDILQVKEKLDELGAKIPIIAKIERSEAFARLDGILRRADAVMLRRGDLGAQIELTRVPLVQKEILRLANNSGVPVIIATQMLGSMVSAPRPTRAEASDVSNAIADGADGVMLSTETAVGRYPIESVRMMAGIIKETEAERVVLHRNIGAESFPSPFADTTAKIACTAAKETHAKLIACFTESGLTARLVAKYRPEVPIIAFCSKMQTRQRLAINWGVRSDDMKAMSDVETMVDHVEKRLLERNLVRPGDRLVIVFGAPVGEMGHTNSVRLHEVVDS